MTRAGGSALGRVRIGSRRSRLARAQAEWVGERMADAFPGLHVEYVTLSTAGDRDPDTPLPDIGGKGVFTEDLEIALHDGRIDLVVHSLKDLPTDRPGDDHLAAIPLREDARDVLVVRPELRSGASSPNDYPGGLTIGTSSVRRAAQVRRLLIDVEVAAVRGNVETRLAKVGEGALDGVILAAAGLRRLGLWPEGAVLLDPPSWLPAPGQGALAVQSRPSDRRVRALAAPLHDPETAAAVIAERRLLGRLEGGCHVPIAAYATVADGRLSLRAAVYAADSSVDPIEGSATGPVAEAARIGESLAEELLLRGAADIL